MSANRNNNALKVLIGILFFLLVGLGVYTYSFYQELSANKVALSEEKLMLQNELSDLLTTYNSEIESSKLMNKELREARSRIQNLLMRLENATTSQTTIQILLRVLKDFDPRLLYRLMMHVLL